MAEQTERPRVAPYLAMKMWRGFQLIKKGDDFVILVTGGTGDGKSTVAALCGWIMKQLGEEFGVPIKFSLDSEYFDPWEFSKALDTQKNGVVIYDEAITGLLNRNAQTSATKAVITSLVMCRSASNCVILCIPTPYLLDWYAAFERVHLWIHCYIPPPKPGKPERKGSMCIFPKAKIMDWYLKGKQHKKVILPRGGVGKTRFTSWFALDKEAYEQKKQAAKRKYAESLTNPFNKAKKDTFKQVIAALHDHEGWSDNRIATFLTESGVKRAKRTTVGDIRRGVPPLTGDGGTDL